MPTQNTTTSSRKRGRLGTTPVGALAVAVASVTPETYRGGGEPRAIGTTPGQRGTTSGQGRDVPAMWRGQQDRQRSGHDNHD
jgi:hypothetical protein